MGLSGISVYTRLKTDADMKRKNKTSRRYFKMAGKVTANNGQVGENVKFDRIRRITGYLVGTTDRFNNAKRAEERDRVKHSL